MNPSVEDFINLLPLPLRQEVQNDWVEFQQKNPVICTELIAFDAFVASVATVWALSHFIAKNTLRYPDVIKDLFQSQDMSSTYIQTDYQHRLTALMAAIQDEKSLSIALRGFRCREMLRIAWRDLMRWSSVTETLRDLSNLADALIQHAAEKLTELFSQTIGVPVDDQGRKQSLLIIAVGKLGGQELNFSSDVDLIFCYNNEGMTAGKPHPLDNQTFFLRVVQALVKVLSEQSVEGFVYRVDARLRPFGESGPLVLKYNAMEIYYQAHGREWERYALIKARIICGNEQAQKLQTMLQRFVYRRYIDYGVIDALRDLKELMDRETRQRSLENNIKRGAGGIREIEFIVQALQLIRGGKETYLQNHSLLQALMLLEAYHCLEKKVVKELRQAYLFFRDVENRLQIFKDAQTQTLPTDEMGQLRLAFSLGYTSFDLLNKEIIRHRKNVRRHFSAMIASHYSKQQPTLIVQRTLNDVKTIWMGKIDEDRVRQIFAALHYEGDIALFIQVLQRFRKSARVRLISSIARKRLDELFPYLIVEIIACDNSVVVLERVISVLEAIVRRSAYLSLLLENPAILKRFILLCSRSALITQQLARSPLLLDELLIEAENTFQSLADLESDLHYRLLSIPEDDIEEQIACLHQFKQIHLLRLAAADVLGTKPLVDVSIGLSQIAAVILNQAQMIIWDNLVKQYGYPMNDQDIHHFARFTIIAYGKLGGYELGYSSDLDLVFLYEGEGNHLTNGSNPLSNSEFYTKMAQRLIHLLCLQTISGTLYEIDLQLRPSGNAGLLVTNIDAFAAYQYEKAWTWEHQALVRARAITGSDEMKAQFQVIRYQVLTRAREEKQLKNQIVEMRSKMQERETKKRKQGFDVKHTRGGVTDIEFMVQYCVLLWAHDYPSLTMQTDNIQILEELYRLLLLSRQASLQLIEAYKVYRAIIHRAALQNESVLILPDEALQAYQKQVLTLWQVLLGQA